jgi:hypothetical protein
MNRIVLLIRSALSCTLQTWPGKVGLAVIVLAILAIITIMNPIRDSDSRDAEVRNGWVTNCAGPAFSRFSQGSNSGPGPEHPVFKINDQLVLAVPKKNWPSAGQLDRKPPKCTQISDLPPAPYLYFVIRGNWSAGYKPEDVPIVGGHTQFQPDVITVRIQREIINPLPVEEQEKVKKLLRKWAEEDSTGLRELGGLTCSTPKYAGSPPHCSGSRPNSELNLSYTSYSATPFVFVNADYPSSRYGKIQVYWQGWISDVSHALEIDATIFNSIEDWNLMNKPAAQAAQP